MPIISNIQPLMQIQCQGALFFHLERGIRSSGKGPVINFIQFTEFSILIFMVLKNSVKAIEAKQNQQQHQSSQRPESKMYGPYISCVEFSH